MQIGLGVRQVATQKIYTAGTLQQTGNSLDVAIEGDGFFQITMPDGTLAYTRAGNFKLDKEGNMVTNDNDKVMGYPVDPVTGLRTGTDNVPFHVPTLNQSVGGAPAGHAAQQPDYGNMAVPSVWRTNRTQATARVDALSSSGMEDFEIPAFLRRQSI